jgi:hypothetical protein
MMTRLPLARRPQRRAVAPIPRSAPRQRVGVDRTELALLRGVAAAAALVTTGAAMPSALRSTVAALLAWSRRVRQ